MKQLILTALLACVCAGLAAANAPEMSSKDSSITDTLKRLEQDLGDAMVAVDIDKLDQILADDWESIGLSGKIATKESVVANLKSGKDKLESFEIGPMDVQVLGNVAAVHGSVTEKRSWNGKDTSGQLIWMDLLEKRGDRWVVIRSAGARVK